mgnify:CR=1 FL=1
MACNMACKYCYLEDNTKDEWNKFGALDTLKYAVEKFHDSNVIPFNISLHGGEVTTLSKKDFESVVKYIYDYYKDNKKLIESNGFRVGSPHIKTNLFDLEKMLNRFVETPLKKLLDFARELPTQSLPIVLDGEIKDIALVFVKSLIARSPNLYSAVQKNSFFFHENNIFCLPFLCFFNKYPSNNLKEM